MPGSPKKQIYREFWYYDSQNISWLYQNSEKNIYRNIYIIYIYLDFFNNIYDPAWGNILNFPEKEI